MQTINLYLLNGIYWITAALYTPFISMYLKERGLTSFQIGILMGIMPVAMMVVQPLWTKLADKTGRHKSVLILLCGTCGVLALAFIKADTFWKLFVLMSLYAVFCSPLLPLTDALVVSRAEEQEMDFSLIRIVGTVSYAIATLILGFAMKEKAGVMFVSLAVSYIVYLVILSSFPRKSISGKEKVQYSSNRIFKDHSIYTMLVFAFALMFGLMYHSSFLGVYMVELGYSHSLLGVLSFLSAMSEVPILLMIRKLMNKYSERTLLFTAVMCCTIRLVLVSTGIAPLMCVAQLCQGPSYMIVYYVCVVGAAKRAFPGKESQAQSVLAIVEMGLGSLLGTVFGGAIAEKAGVKTGFYIIAAILVILDLAAYLMGKKDSVKYDRKST